MDPISSNSTKLTPTSNPAKPPPDNGRMAMGVGVGAVIGMILARRLFR